MSVFEPVLPIEQDGVVLQPSEHHTYDWNFGVRLVGQSDYYLAVLDTPVGGNHPLGFDEEGPTIAAEKKNACGIPARAAAHSAPRRHGSNADAIGAAG